MPPLALLAQAALPAPPDDPSKLPMWALGIAVIVLGLLAQRLDAALKRERESHEQQLLTAREENARRAAETKTAEAERDKALAELSEARVEAERRVAEARLQVMHERDLEWRKSFNALVGVADGYERSTRESAAAITAMKTRIERERA